MTTIRKQHGQNGGGGFIAVCKKTGRILKQFANRGQASKWLKGKAGTK